MKAAHRITVSGKKFKAGDDLSCLSAEELALIPATAILGAPKVTQEEKSQQPSASFKSIDKLNKAELTALAISMGVDVGESDTKASIASKIDAVLKGLDEEITALSREDLIDTLCAHFAENDLPDFSETRDEELKLQLHKVMFVSAD